MNIQNVVDDAPPPPRISANPGDSVYQRCAVEEVVRVANESNRRPTGLSEFSVASMRGDVDGAGCVQIRASLGVDPSAPEFRFMLQARGDVAIVAEPCAFHVVEAARRFVEVADLTDFAKLRAVVDWAIEPATGGCAPMRIVATGLMPAATGDQFAVTVDVEALGHDLRLGVERVIGWNPTEVAEELTAVVASHVERARTLDRSLAAGGHGWIDGAALRILDASGLGLGDAFERLRRDERLELHFEDRQGRETTARFFWEEGVVLGAIERMDADWSFEGDCLTIPHPKLPETVITAWAGRRIAEIVEQDFIPHDAVIVELDQALKDWVALTLAIKPVLLDAAMGLPCPVKRPV